MTAVGPTREATTHVVRPRAVSGAAVRHRARVPMPRPMAEPVRSDPPAVEGRSRPIRRSAVVLATMLAVALLALAVVTFARPAALGGPGVGEAYVEVHGQALVRRADGTSQVVTGRVDLGPGDSLTLRSGRADLELADDVSYAAVAGRGAVPGTEIVMGATPRLLRGSLLVAAPRGAVVASGAGDGRVELATGSIARLRATAALRVGLYSGSANVVSAGATRAAPTYRFVEVVGAGDITRPRPLDYRAGDRWDESHLGAALALDRQLDAIVDGLTAGSVDPAAMPERVRRVLSRPPSAATVAALVEPRRPGFANAIAVAAAGHGSRPFADGWARAVGFHDAGARWGLVALDLGAEPDAVVDALLASLEGSPVPTTPAVGASDGPGNDGADALDGRTADEGVAGAETGDGRSVDDRGGDPVDGAGPGSGPVAGTPDGTPTGPGAGPAPSVPGTPSGPGAGPGSPPVVGPVLQPLEPVVAPLAPVLQPVTETVGTIGGGLVGTVDTVVQPLDPLLGGVTDPLIGSGGVVPGLLGGLLP